MSKLEIPIESKMLLTIKEASALSGLGEKKIRQIVRENPSADYVLMNGVKYLIKRKQLEKLIDDINSL